MHRRQGRDWGLVEEARRLKQGAHTYRRQEALARRDRRRERFSGGAAKEGAD